MELKHELFLQEKQDSQYITDAVCDLTFSLFLRTNIQDESVFNNNPLQTIQFDVINNKPTTLKEIEDIIENAFKSIEFSATYAFSSCFLVEDRIYVVSRGLGGVYLLKDNNLHSLINGDQSASGKASSVLYMVLGSNELSQNIDEKILITSIVQIGDEFVDGMTSLFKEVDLGGLIVSTLKAQMDTVTENDKQEDNDELLTENETDSTQEIIKHSPIKTFIAKMASIKPNVKRSKTATIIIVIVIAAFLLWSVGSGNKRRIMRNLDTKASQLEGPLTAKLLDAEETVILSGTEARAQLKEAEDIIRELQREAKSNGIENLPSISRLENKIKDTKKVINTSVNKKAKEYYDIQLLGTNVSIDGFISTNTKSFGLIDSKNKTAYLITDENKNITKYKAKQLTSDSSLVFNETNLIFFDKKTGVFLMEPEKSPKKVINSEGWNKPIDITTFNNNIYILDAGADEIYKYVSYEGGYSSKTSYFKQSESLDLKNTTNFVVDASFYIAFRDGPVAKYTSGIRDQFALSSKKNSTITKILTTETSEYIYVFSKEKGIVNVFQKNGTYSKELTSPQLKNADDVTLIDDKLLFLKGLKIYTLE